MEKVKKSEDVTRCVTYKVSGEVKEPTNIVEEEVPYAGIKAVDKTVYEVYEVVEKVDNSKNKAYNPVDVKKQNKYPEILEGAR